MLVTCVTILNNVTLLSVSCGPKVRAYVVSKI